MKMRQGRKACTLITGFEPFQVFSAEDMAEDLRKACAGSTSVSPIPGKPAGAGMEVLVQGKQSKIVVDYLLAKGVPKKWIQVTDMSGKKWKKRLNSVLLDSFLFSCRFERHLLKIVFSARYISCDILWYIRIRVRQKKNTQSRRHHHIRWSQIAWIAPGFPNSFQTVKSRSFISVQETELVHLTFVYFGHCLRDRLLTAIVNPVQLADLDGAPWHTR